MPRRLSEELPRKEVIDTSTRPVGQSARSPQLEQAGRHLHDFPRVKLEIRIDVFRQAKVSALRELQSQTQEELDTLLPSVLRPSATVGRAFKGEL